MSRRVTFIALAALAITGCGSDPASVTDPDARPSSDDASTPDVDVEALWTELLAIPGVDWVYRPRDGYLDLEHTQRVAHGEAVRSFKAIGADIPNISDLDWTAGGGEMDYTLEQLWYGSLGPRPVFYDRGHGDEYVRFDNGSATNFESQPGQLDPREAQGEQFHLLYAFRPMPGSSYEGLLNASIQVKDRSGDGQQMIIYYGGDPAIEGPSGVVTRWGEDHLLELAIDANGEVTMTLDGAVVVTGTFPSLPANGFSELALGTSSHIASHQFRALIIQRGGFFSSDELGELRRLTNELWPRGELPRYPYLDGQHDVPYTSFDVATQTWTPPTGTFSGGNGQPGTHLYQWYYWDGADAVTFPERNPLREHRPFPGADGQRASLTRTDFAPGNSQGNPVIFEPGNEDIWIMRTIVPRDSSNAAGEPLAGAWTRDN